MTAKAWALARVRKDGRGAPEKLKGFFVELEPRLFNKKLRVEGLARACRLGNRARANLTQYLGVQPRRYIDRLRMEVAARMLGEPGAKIWQIAEEVGYGDLESFSVAFKRFYGVGPDVYRKAQGVPGGAVGSQDFAPQAIQRGLRGLLEPEEARDLLRTLRSLYPRRAISAATDGRKLFMVSEAAHVWAAIRGASFEMSRTTVHAHGSRELFQLLLKKSREEGRGNAWQGVELALLAVESLDACAGELGETVHDLQALGWAWVGNARRLVPGRVGAGEAMLRAEAAWAVPRANPDPMVEAVLWRYRAALCSYERRFEEALELASRAVRQCRSRRATDELARGLIDRGRIHLYAGSPQATIVDNREALALLGDREDYLRLSGYQILAMAYVYTHDLTSAERALRQAKLLCFKYGMGAWLRILRVEGLIHQGRGDIARAETCLVEAHQGLLELGQIEDAAVVALDRAILCAEQGRSAEVVPLATEVAAVFEASRVERERLAALRVLGAEVAKGAVSLEMLRNARDELRSVPAV